MGRISHPSYIFLSLINTFFIFSKKKKKKLESRKRFFVLKSIKHGVF